MEQVIEEAQAPENVEDLILNHLPEADITVSSNGKVHATFMTITPAIAAEMLKLNTKNRTLSDLTARIYGRDMVRKTWFAGVDTVSFDEDNALLNGQHRLKSCVDTCSSFETLVAWGVDPDARPTVDVHRRRSASDDLRMKQVANSRMVASTSRLYMQYRDTVVGLTQETEYTKSDIIDFAIDRLEDIQLAVAKGRACSASVSGASATVCAVTYLITSALDLDEANDYIDGLTSTKGLEGPTHTVYKRLQSYGRNSSAKLPPSAQLWVMLRGWNALRRHESLDRIIIPVSTTGKSMIKAV